MSDIHETSKQIARYRIRRNAWAIATMVFFVLSACSTSLFGFIDFPIALGMVIGFALAAFFCAFMIRQASTYEEYVIHENAEPLDLKTMTKDMEGITVYDLRGEESFEGGAQSYIVDEKVNKLFSLRPVYAKISEEPFMFAESVIPYVPYLKDDRNRELSRHEALRPNKEVMGLDSDIDEKLFDSERPTVGVCSLTRYAVQVTDDAFDKVIENKKDDNAVVFVGRDLAIDKDGRLMNIEKSLEANAMDIQSLILSSDGYVMFAKGTKQHPLYASKVIPSAACSLLPAEVEEHTPLQEQMIESIHEKLFAIYDMPHDVEIMSSFCGMSRIVERGGSPEFYCVTRINLDKDTIVRMHKDATSTFDAVNLTNLVEGLEESANPSKLISKACESVFASAGTNISLSASALLKCVMLAMQDEEHAEKVLKRIGVVEGYVPSSVGRETVIEEERNDVAEQVAVAESTSEVVAEENTEEHESESKQDA